MKKTTPSIKATIKGKPIAWARAADGNNRRHTPEPYRSWKDTASQVIAFMAGFKRLDGEVSIVIDLHADRVELSAVALEETDHRRPKGVTGDIDNYAKAVLDAMQAAGVVENDSAVAELLIRFRPGDST